MTQRSRSSHQPGDWETQVAMSAGLGGPAMTLRIDLLDLVQRRTALLFVTYICIDCYHSTLPYIPLTLST